MQLLLGPLAWLRALRQALLRWLVLLLLLVVLLLVLVQRQWVPQMSQQQHEEGVGAHT